MLPRCPKCAKGPKGASAEKLEALPRSEECGRGLFECQDCGHTWSSNTAFRALAQYCTSCDAVDVQRGTYPSEIRLPKPLWLIQRLQKKVLNASLGAEDLQHIPEDSASDHPHPARPADVVASGGREGVLNYGPSTEERPADGTTEYRLEDRAPRRFDDLNEPSGTFFYDPSKDSGGGAQAGGTTFYEQTFNTTDTKISAASRPEAAAPASDSAPPSTAPKAQRATRKTGSQKGESLVLTFLERLL